MKRKLLTISIAASAVLLAAASTQAAERRERDPRQLMQRCVASVLSGLARAHAPESQVGPAVIARCDGPLRASLEAAIRSGEAAGCTVESCMDMARSRAAEEATQAYSQRVGR